MTKRRPRRKVRFTHREMRSLRKKETRLYVQGVMKKAFRAEWKKHLHGLMDGDAATLGECAQLLSDNLDLFPLLHILCLVTGQKFDLDETDPIRAADRWLTWYHENRGRLQWCSEKEMWSLPG